MADRYAKNMASKILKGEIIAPRNISVNDCYKIASDIVHKSWQRYWDNEQKGRSTYDLIPVVGTKVIFPSKRFSGVAYCRMLLHDTMLNSDSYRTGTADTPICDCGHALETTEHFLLHCNRYEKERKDMFDFIYHSGVTTKQNKSSIVTEALLLSPSVDKSVNSRYNRIVKEALFEFLDKVNRAMI